MQPLFYVPKVSLKIKNHSLNKTMLILTTCNKRSLISEVTGVGRFSLSSHQKIGDRSCCFKWEWSDTCPGADGHNSGPPTHKGQQQSSLSGGLCLNSYKVPRERTTLAVWCPTFWGHFVGRPDDKQNPVALVLLLLHTARENIFVATANPLSCGQILLLTQPKEAWTPNLGKQWGNYTN